MLDEICYECRKPLSETGSLGAMPFGKCEFCSDEIESILCPPCIAKIEGSISSSDVLCCYDCGIKLESGVALSNNAIH